MYSKRVLRYPSTWQKLDSVYYPNFCNTASKTLPHYCLNIALLYLATISDSLNALSTLHPSPNNFALVANIYLCLPFLSPSWILHLWQDDLVFHTQFRAFVPFRYDFVISIHCHFKPQFVSAEWEGISSPCLWFGGEMEEVGKEEGRKAELPYGHL